MLAFILGLMAYDTAKSLNDEMARKNKVTRINELENKLKNPITKGHSYSCPCLSCNLKRKSAKEELNKLKSYKG